MLNILIVDDDGGALDFLEMLLTMLGHSVTKAGIDSARMLAAMDDADVAVAVVESSMTTVDGLVAIRGLASAKPDLKIIATMRKDTDELRAAARRYGVVQVLPKPFGALEISSALLRLLRPERRSA